MAAAVPLAVGLVAGGITYAAVTTDLMVCMTVGMIAMTIAEVLMAPKKAPAKYTSADYALQTYDARSDDTALPRGYGTFGCGANLVGYFNYFWKRTRSSESESKVY